MNLKPLLCRPPLFFDETLASYLYRLSFANTYTPRMFEVLCRERMPYQDSIFLPTRAETFAVLATLTMMRAQALYWASSHRFSWFLAEPGKLPRTIGKLAGRELRSLSPKDAKIHLRSSTQVQYCPHCLAEAAYQRQAWLLMVTAACLKHRCLLIDRCSACSQRLRLIDLILVCCSNCGHTLTDTQSTDLSADQRGLPSQALLHSWASVGPVVATALPCQSGKILYDIVFALTGAMFRVKNEMEGLHPIPEFKDLLKCRCPPDRTSAHYYVATTTAMQALFEWPLGFHSFLERYRTRDGRKRPQGLVASFASFYVKWLPSRWGIDTYRFLQIAFTDYLVSNFPAPAFNESIYFQRNPIPEERFVWMTVTDAARALGVTPRSVAHLSDAGLITTREGVCARPFRLLARADIIALKQHWSEGIPLRDASLLLGVSENVVLDMVRAGLLQAVRGPDIDGSVAWAISRPSIEELLAEVQAVAKYTRSLSEQYVNLVVATQMLAVHNFNIAGLLQLILKRELNCWVGPTDRLKDLAFSVKEIETLVGSIYDGRPLVTRKQIAKIMKVKPSTVTEWARNGLLKAALIRNQIEHYNRQAFQTFVDEHVFVQEASEILAIDKLVVQKWARNGRLKPVSGPGVDNRSVYLFRRADIERLRPENRLTAPQMAKRLGLCRSHLREWIRKGKVRPISGPGIDQCRQYLFLVEDAEADNER